jgi:Protein of unknown function (DUF1003)
MTTETTSPVPHHVEEAVATIAALHAAHHREARALQKAVSRATSGIAQPATLILTSFAIASWVTLNLALPEFGRTALDPFPFPLLAAVVSTIALYLAAMILMTQRHDDEMATRREQITLETRHPQRAEIVQDHSAPGRISPQRSKPRQSTRQSGRGTGRARRCAGRARCDPSGGKGGGRRLGGRSRSPPSP